MLPVSHSNFQFISYLGDSLWVYAILMKRSIERWYTYFEIKWKIVVKNENVFPMTGSKREKICIPSRNSIIMNWKCKISSNNRRLADFKQTNQRIDWLRLLFQRGRSKRIFYNFLFFFCLFCWQAKVHLLCAHHVFVFHFPIHNTSIKQ